MSNPAKKRAVSAGTVLPPLAVMLAAMCLGAQLGGSLPSAAGPAGKEAGLQVEATGNFRELALEGPKAAARYLPPRRRRAVR